MSPVSNSNCRTCCATRIFVAVTFASLALTQQSDREANGFSWGPIKEVAILFACIFICIAPVIAILHAGLQRLARAAGEAW